jgi:hypothetical protein
VGDPGQGAPAQTAGQTPFRFHTPATLEYPAGITASSLDALRDGVAAVEASSLFHHVVRMQVRFPTVRDIPENDFARWVGDALQLPELSERLAFLGSTPIHSMEDLRSGLLAVLDGAGTRDRSRESSDGAAFHFIRIRTVLSPLGLEASDPVEVMELWPRIDLGAVFLHLVEAPAFGWDEHALIPWLRAGGAGGLAETAASLVAAGLPLARLHRDLNARWRRSMIGRRLAERFDAPEEVRRREAREVMARLASRLRSAASDGGAK